MAEGQSKLKQWQLKQTVKCASCTDPDKHRERYEREHQRFMAMRGERDALKRENEEWREVKLPAIAAEMDELRAQRNIMQRKEGGKDG